MNLEVGKMDIIARGEGPLLTPVDLDGFRQWNRQKSTALIDKRMSEQEAVEKFVSDGSYIGFELYGTVRCPMSLTREIVRSGKKNLRLAGQGVHEVDLLLGNHQIEAIDFTYIGLEVFGISSNVRRAIESGEVKTVVEWSNAALTWRMKATAMGVPFVATRSMLGSDTLKHSAACVVECPFSGEKVVLLPALILDTAFIHVNRADKYGNCQVDGISGFAFEMARATKRLVISTEKIVDGEEIRSAPDQTIIPYYLVDGVVEAPFGSWPGEMSNCYERDDQHYKDFLKAQQSEEGMDQYLKEWVLDLPNHQALIEKIGLDNLNSLKLGDKR
jgi:glutaconate CoA-transferase, subunit A